MQAALLVTDLHLRLLACDEIQLALLPVLLAIGTREQELVRQGRLLDAEQGLYELPPE